MISIRPTLDGTYGKIDLDLDVPVLLFDHLGGFTIDQENRVLDELNECTQQSRDVYCEYILSDKIKSKYPKLKFYFDETVWKHGNNIDSLVVPEKPKHNFENFICTFNSAPHISRKLLVSAIHRREWWDPNYSSKCFAFHPHEVIGHLYEYLGPNAKWNINFFTSAKSEDFYGGHYSFGSTSLDHNKNFLLLQQSISQSFVHIVSETMATNYYPFVTEKCFYSIASQGLFLAYAQPGWHKHFETYFGFKKYTKIFDYTFDHIVNPVERLTAMLDMLSKFRLLTRFDWHDLWMVERDTIMHNYMHLAGGQYLWHLRNRLGTTNSLITQKVNNI